MGRNKIFCEHSGRVGSGSRTSFILSRMCVCVFNRGLCSPSRFCMSVSASVRVLTAHMLHPVCVSMCVCPRGLYPPSRRCVSVCAYVCVCLHVCPLYSYAPSGLRQCVRVCVINAFDSMSFSIFTLAKLKNLKKSIGQSRFKKDPV